MGPCYSRCITCQQIQASSGRQGLGRLKQGSTCTLPLKRRQEMWHHPTRSTVQECRGPSAASSAAASRLQDSTALPPSMSTCQQQGKPWAPDPKPVRACNAKHQAISSHKAADLDQQSNHQLS